MLGAFLRKTEFDVANPSTFESPAVHGEQCTRIMSELHEGVCGSHVGGRALARKVLCAGYYWPTLKEDCVGYAQRCKQCQQHADWHKAPPGELRSIHSPWPFHTWGIDILGPFPLAVRLSLIHI